MDWRLLRPAPWLDTRARFVARLPRGGALLDVGSSDGETLRHFAQLRPDLALRAVDVAGTPERYPAGCDFRRLDVERDPLPWVDASMDGVTCLQLVEHLHDPAPLMREVARVLRPGAPIFLETPHPRTLELPSAKEHGFTLNFYDDATHVRVVPPSALAAMAVDAGLSPMEAGTSRNLLFAAAHLALRLGPPSRQALTARAHHVGWSSYLIARRPDVSPIAA